MKTVIDAVNKYRAKWEDGKNYIYVGSSSNTIRCGSLQITHRMVENNQWEFVCNESEFNKCVEEMANNGMSITYSKYKDDYIHNTGEMTNMNIKPDDLLDESTRQYKISIIGNVLHNMSCSMDDENEQNEFGGFASFCWDLADEFKKSECAVDTTKSERLVYTQAMVDAGVMPSVGMEVLINSGTFYKATGCVKLTGDSKGRWIVEIDGEYCIYCSDELAPLTPSIELIDGKAYQFDNRSGESYCGIYHGGRNIFYIDHGQYFDDIAVTNIQLLEVK